MQVKKSLLREPQLDCVIFKFVIKRQHCIQFPFKEKCSLQNYDKIMVSEIQVKVTRCQCVLEEYAKGKSLDHVCRGHSECLKSMPKTITMQPLLKPVQIQIS